MASMPVLKELLTRLRLNEAEKALMADGRRGIADRRSIERRKNVFPLQDRETRLRFAAQVAGFGIYDLDCLTGDTHWSPELKAIAGLSPDWQAQSVASLVEMVHPDDRGRTADRFQASLSPHGDGELEDECRLLRPDGEVVWIRLKGRTLFAGQGELRRPLAATGIVMDVTSSRKAEEALQRSQQDLELAIHGAAMGVWNWNLRTGEFTWSNRCYQLFGIPAGETMTYERFLAAIHPEDRDKTVTGIRYALGSSDESGMEYRVVWPDGSIHWIAVMGRVYHDPDTHETLRMTGSAIDITDRKELEEALRRTNLELESRIAARTEELVRANEALVRSNLELQQFGFIAAHDLQTPLRSISGFAQLLQKDYAGRLDAKADDWLGRLIRSAQRMHELIRDLLTYSQVDSRGKAFEPIPLKQVFNDVLATLEAPIRENCARVTQGELPTLQGDRIQLAQVLHNLIDNALKYRREIPPRIRVSARRRENEWEFSVRDNGIGIEAKHLENIFDIFHRLHTQQAYPGTGIGLAVCRRVIHRHGGRIWAESRPGKGSVFRFTLPARD